MHKLGRPTHPVSGTGAEPVNDGTMRVVDDGH